MKEKENKEKEKKEKSTEADVKPPKESCNDKNCPFHGNLKVRGRIFTGKVISSRMHKSSTVVWEISRFIKKYERYEKKRTKIHVHNPSCIDAKEGDVVKIMETRPLSKTKNFVILEVVKKEK